MNDTFPHAQGLSYRASLPFQWQALSAAEFDAGLHGWHNQNLETIQNTLLFEHQPRELAEEDSDTSVQLQQLDLKMNLVMELLMQVMTMQQAIPEQQELEISADGIVWKGVESPSEEQLILIQVYLCDRYPRPLIFPAQVLKVSGSICHAEFLSLNELLLDKLQQLIFLYHRRQIADSRKS